MNTTDHETGRELIGTPAALAAWLKDAGLPSSGCGPAALARAHALRSALHALIVDGVVGDAFDDPAARARFTIDVEGARVVPRADGVDAALGTIVATVYEAIRDGSWTRLKGCRNCGWAFWDDSRNRSAAWCSMQLCGNRLKVRRHRARRRG